MPLDAQPIAPSIPLFIGRQNRRSHPQGGPRAGWLALCLALLCLVRCGAKDTIQAVVVTLDSSAAPAATARVDTLVVTAELNGVAAMGNALTLTSKMNPFTLEIPVGQSGSLRVAATGLSATEEILVTGAGQVTLTGTGAYTLTVALTPVQPDPTTVSFAMPVFYGTGGDGYAFFAAGHLVDDGLPAVVASVAGAGEVDVFLDQGQGIYPQTPTAIAEELQVYGVGVGDIDGDGHADLLVCQGGDVIYRSGNGKGGFGASNPVATGLESVALIAVQDVNMDSALDVVVSTAQGVAVYLNNGKGKFDKYIDITFTTAISGGAVGDLNGDGKPDLVVTHMGGVRLLLGDGTGNFTGKDLPGVTGDFKGVAISDWDLALVDGVQDTVTVLSGNNDGTFQPAAALATDMGSVVVRSADVNSDNKPDLLVANSIGGTVSVLLANGDGTFQKARDFQAGMYPQDLLALDANGDGKIDMALIASPQGEDTQSAIAILLNTSAAN